jgi:hypothetical protein
VCAWKVFPPSVSVRARPASEPVGGDGDADPRAPVTDPHPAIIKTNAAAYTPDHLAT